MNTILQLIKELQIYSKYTSFEYTLGIDKDKPYEKWRIYTGDINHNEFKTKEELIDFMTKLVHDKTFYYTRNRAKLEQRLEYVNENIKEHEKEKIEIENYLKQTSIKSSQ